eukprot:gene3696-5040_t
MLRAAVKRVQKELATLSEDESVLNLRPISSSVEDIRNLTATIVGPPNSHYAGYEFDLKILVPPEYPITPPVISFTTKIFHPNVLFKSGEICLDILKSEWTPAWTIQSACRAVICILAEPTADSPLNCDAGNILRAND